MSILNLKKRGIICPLHSIDKQVKKKKPCKNNSSSSYLILCWIRTKILGQIGTLRAFSFQPTGRICNIPHQLQKRKSFLLEFFFCVCVLACNTLKYKENNKRERDNSELQFVWMDNNKWNNENWLAIWCDWCSFFCNWNVHTILLLFIWFLMNILLWYVYSVNLIFVFLN